MCVCVFMCVYLQHTYVFAHMHTHIYQTNTLRTRIKIPGEIIIKKIINIETLIRNIVDSK